MVNGDYVVLQQCVIMQRSNNLDGNYEQYKLGLNDVAEFI